MKYGVGVGREQHSAAEPSPFWSSASYVINILLLKAQVRHRALCSPAPDYAFELKVTFCVRGVLMRLRADLRSEIGCEERESVGEMLWRECIGCARWVLRNRCHNRARPAGDARTEALRSPVHRRRSWGTERRRSRTV